MTELGQTDNYTLADHIKAMQDHVGKKVFDYCLVDTGEIVPEYVRKYNKNGSEIVEANITEAAGLGVKIIQKDMSCIKNDRIRHNSAMIASTVIELICNELKFKDEQNGTEFLLLNSILKEDKKNIKKEQKVDQKKKEIVKKATQQVKAQNNHRKSKFSEKYKERVESIQNTEAKIKENRAIAKEIEKLEKSKNAKSKKSKDKKTTDKPETKTVSKSTKKPTKSRTEKQTEKKTKEK